MIRTTYQSLQEQIMEYFKDTDDKTFIAPVGNNTKVSTLIETFLKDNGLSDAYVNYLLDLKDEDIKEHQKRFFNRSSLSQRDMIEKVKSAMLNASFNRFRKNQFKKTRNTEASSALKSARAELKKLQDLIEKFMNPKDTDEFDFAIDKLRQMKF